MDTSVQCIGTLLRTMHGRNNISLLKLIVKQTPLLVLVANFSNDLINARLYRRDYTVTRRQ